jgi:hypothetical protein
MTLFYFCFWFLIFSYFFFFKSKFDLFSISFLSLSVYFSPALFGKVLNPYNFTFVNLNFKVYFVFIIIFSILLLFSIFSDLLIRRKIGPKNLVLSFDPVFYKICFYISLSSMFIFIFTYNKFLFSTNYTKSQMLDNILGDRWHIIWIYTASIGFLYCLSKKIRVSKLYFYGFLLMFLINLIIGHRSNVAFIFLTLITISLHNSNISLYKLFLKKFSHFLILFFSGSLFLLYKFVYPVFKFNYSYKLLNSDFIIDIFYKSIFFSEPFLVQSTLNETIRFSIKSQAVSFEDFFVLFIPFSPEIFQINSNFSGYLNQTRIFPNLSWGTANNIWAFIFSSYDWLGLFLFIVFFCTIIFFSNFLFLRLVGFSKYFLTYNFVIFVFYINRNSLFTQLNFQKRVLLIFLLNYMLYVITRAIIKKFK